VSSVSAARGHHDQLLVDRQLAAEEVDPVDAHSEGLALAQARASGQGYEGQVSIGHRLGECLDRLKRRRIPDRPCRAKTGGTDEIVRVRRSELPDRVVDQEDACGRSSCT
jgi:hypothetical protein